MIGKVVFFDPVKGFWFLRPEAGGADVFVHISAVEDAGLGELTEGQLLSFDTEPSRRPGKLQAVDLAKV